MKKIIGLDALRALSVLLVILSHVGVTNAVSTPVLKSFFTVFNAFTGVTIFFVISGFLITTLLIAEKQKTGIVNIKNFFVRRALRTLPLYYVAILIAALFGLFGVQQISSAALLHGITYTYNFVRVQDNVGFLSHLWSLAVEEQFYLLWPFIFASLIVKPLRLIGICILSIVACYMAYLAIDLDSPIPNTYYVTRWFLPAAYPIFVGCLFALSCHHWSRFREFLATKAALAASVIMLFWPLIFPDFTAAVAEWFSPLQFLERFVVVTGIAGTISWLVLNQESWVVKRLDWGPIGYLGKISYGLYVWQGIFTGNGNIDSHYWPPPVIWGVVLTFGVSIVSYHVFEMPFLKLKGRFSWKKPPSGSPNSTTAADRATALP